MGEFTDSEKMEYIDRMISRVKGDDLERCEYTFKDLSPDTMKSEYGWSGRTHAEVLESYRRDRRLHNTVVGMIKEALHI